MERKKRTEAVNSGVLSITIWRNFLGLKWAILTLNCESIIKIKTTCNLSFLRPSG